MKPINRQSLRKRKYSRKGMTKSEQYLAKYIYSVLEEQAEEEIYGDIIESKPSINWVFIVKTICLVVLVLIFLYMSISMFAFDKWPNIIICFVGGEFAVGIGMLLQIDGNHDGLFRKES